MKSLWTSHRQQNQNKAKGFLLNTHEIKQTRGQEHVNLQLSMPRQRHSGLGLISTSENAFPGRTQKWAEPFRKGKKPSCPFSFLQWKRNSESPFLEKERLLQFKCWKTNHFAQVQLWVPPPVDTDWETSLPQLLWGTQPLPEEEKGSVLLCSCCRGPSLHWAATRTQLCALTSVREQGRAQRREEEWGEAAVEPPTHSFQQVTSAWFSAVKQSKKCA